MFKTPARPSSRSRPNTTTGKAPRFDLESARKANSSLPGSAVGTPTFSGLQLNKNAAGNPQQSAEFLLQSKHFSILKCHPNSSLLDSPTCPLDSCIFDIESGYLAICKPSYILASNSRNASFPLTRLEMPNFDPSSSVPVLACFFNSGHKIGLMAVNSSGLLRMWPTIELPKQHLQLELDLGGHLPSKVFQFNDYTFFLMLEAGMVIRLEVAHSSISFGYLKKASKSLLGFFSSSIASVSLLSGASGEKILNSFPIDDCLCVVTSRVLQKWTISQDSSLDTLRFEIDLHSLLYSCLDAINPVNIEVLGVDYNRQLSCLARLDFSGKPPKYFIASFLENPNGKLTTTFTRILHSPVHTQHPQFVLSKSKVAFIKFSDQLIVASLSRVEWEEVVPFKTKDLIGIGTDNSLLRKENDGSFALLCSSSVGIMEIRLHGMLLKPEMQEIVADVPEVSIQNDLLSKLEQIVFFNSSNEKMNPIALKLSRNSGDLNQPCLDLSFSILNATNPHLPNIFDESAFLSDSFHRAHEIILAISNNSLVDNLSESTRLNLMFNTEKMNVIRNLWGYQNSIYMKGTISDQIHFALLEDSISSFITKRNLGLTVRGFFKSSALLLPEYLAHMQTFMCELLNRKREMDYHLVKEGCRILNITYEAAYSYRFSNSEYYKADLRSFLVEPWTSTPEMLGILQKQFEMAIKAIEKITKKAAEQESQLLSLFLDEFNTLCRNILGSFRDLKSFLQSSGTSSKQIDALWERYRIVQENANLSLLKFGCEEEAFLLAEDFEEFETLVQLTLANKSKDHRIKSYISRFGKPFAVVLYQALLDKKSLQELLALDSINTQYLDDYLKTEDLKHLLWIQDVKHKRYREASENLWQLATTERRVKEQGTAVALSMLNFLAQLEKDDLEKPEIRESLYTFERAQDLITFHTILSDYLKDTVVGEVENLEDVDGTLKAVFERCFSSLSLHYPVLAGQIKIHLNELFRMRKLTPNAIFDIVTLMGEPSDELFFDAFKLICNQKGDDSFFFNLMWRRAWLSNDWVKISNDAEVMSDAQIRERVEDTTIGGLQAQIGSDYDSSQVISPDNIVFKPTNFADLYPGLSSHELDQIILELKAEHDRLIALGGSVNLNTFWGYSGRPFHSTTKN